MYRTTTIIVSNRIGVIGFAVDNLSRSGLLKGRRPSAVPVLHRYEGRHHLSYHTRAPPSFLCVSRHSAIHLPQQTLFGSCCQILIDTEAYDTVPVHFHAGGRIGFLGSTRLVAYSRHCTRGFLPFLRETPPVGIQPASHSPGI